MDGPFQDVGRLSKTIIAGGFSAIRFSWFRCWVPPSPKVKLVGQPTWSSIAFQEDGSPLAMIVGEKKTESHLESSSTCRLLAGVPIFPLQSCPHQKDTYCTSATKKLSFGPHADEGAPSERYAELVVCGAKERGLAAVSHPNPRKCSRFVASLAAVYRRVVKALLCLPCHNRAGPCRSVVERLCNDPGLEVAKNRRKFRQDVQVRSGPKEPDQPAHLRSWL